MRRRRLLFSKNKQFNLFLPNIYDYEHVWQTWKLFRCSQLGKHTINSYMKQRMPLKLHRSKLHLNIKNNREKENKKKNGFVLKHAPFKFFLQALILHVCLHDVCKCISWNQVIYKSYYTWLYFSFSLMHSTLSWMKRVLVQTCWTALIATRSRVRHRHMKRSWMDSRNLAFHSTSSICYVQVFACVLYTNQ